MIYSFCLKFQFPFLINVWNKINDFDKDIENDSQKSGYVSTCSYFFSPWTGGEDKYEHFCMKLIRNLGHRSNNKDFLKHTSERCNNLNIWIYNSMKKHGIPENIITKCFEDYNGFMRGIRTDPRCSYYSYDTNYNEPINIIKLNIFESNMDIIHNKLDRAYDSVNLPLQMYICECIDIFKKMYKKYCPKMDADSEKRKRTCNMLELIKTTYNLFISGKLYQNNKMPSLDNDSDEYFDMCPQNNPNSKLRSEAKGVSHVLEPLNVVIDEDTDEASSYVGYKNYETDGVPSLGEGNGGNQVSPTARTVSTTVGTIAGASSVLALLYKVD
ncbi:hypothetical protein PVBG_04756 [Plasmodium vivax Brazil I]|uniref:Variable surface protein n=1 Tax=Plasmodium vivax (strain Brazil I) TaxID=1033975 RepID=A0A0J9T1S2_PLAV1|nr:hypothetical protein PVBG_04756 [Plasmodium vivax Brazil I]